MKTIVFLSIAGILVLVDYVQHHKKFNKCGKDMWECSETWVMNFIVLTVTGAVML